MMSGQIYDGFIPGRHLIDSYGDGGFRFAGMSHKGSLLILPSGIRAWRLEENLSITRTVLSDFFAGIMPDITAEANDIDLLLIGTGKDIVLPAAGFREKFRDINVKIDLMQTGSALRTYNILFAENRRVAAALIAVAD